MNNKIILLSTLLASVPVVSMANEVDLSEGTQEISAQGNLNLDHWDDYQFLLDSSYGYFILDDWEVGGNVGINMTGSNKRYTFGAFTEYNFTNSTNFVPYLGLATQFAALSYSDANGLDGDLGKDGNNSALNLKVAAGVKYFINPNVALSAEVNYNVATDDINVSSDSLESSFSNIVFGTKFYF